MDNNLEFWKSQAEYHRNMLEKINKLIRDKESHDSYVRKMTDTGVTGRVFVPVEEFVIR